MGKFSTLLGIAALAGIGFYVGKKVIEKKNLEQEHIFENESDVFVEERHSSPKEKLQRASLFAVGAIKTGTEKFKEGIDDIINNDMVSKGEKTVAETKGKVIETKEKAVNFAMDAKDKTVGFAKGAAESVKGEIENLKNMVTSINKTPSDEETVEEAETEAPAEAEEAENAEDADVSEAVEEAAEEAVEEIAELEETAADEIDKSADDIDDISLESLDNDAVDTFDFGSSTSEIL